MSQSTSTSAGDPLAAVRAATLAGRPLDTLAASDAVLASATDSQVIVEATAAKADALVAIGRPADAFTLLRSLHDKEKAAGRPGAAATISMAEAALRMAAGDLPAAGSALIEAANDFGSGGDAAGQIRAQLQLASTYAMNSQPANVRAVLEGCLAAAQQLGDPGVLAEVRHQEGSFLAASGANPVPSFEDGLRAADQSTNPTAQVQLRVDLGYAVARHDPNRSTTLLVQAEAIAMGVGDLLTSADGLATLAQGWWAVGRMTDSLRCADQALVRLRSVGAWPLFVRLAVGITDMCTAAGRPADAQRYAVEGIAAGGQVGGPGGEANVMVMIGQAAAQRGDRQTAQYAFSEAARRLRVAGLPIPPPLSAAINDPGRPG